MVAMLTHARRSQLVACYYRIRYMLALLSRLYANMECQAHIS
jgi:hypothetical protein